MVETRASRRAAEEDIVNPSLPVRARSSVNSDANDSAPPPRTPRPRTRSQMRGEDSISSSQTPSVVRARSRSATRPQTPATAPRTRSRARREAEDSAASSGVRQDTPHPHPAEEDSHNLGVKKPTKKSASSVQNRTSHSVSGFADHALQTPSRHTRSVSRKGRAVDAKNVPNDDEREQLSATAKRSRSQHADQTVVSDAELQRPDTPDPRRLRNLPQIDLHKQNSDGREFIPPIKHNLESIVSIGSQQDATQSKTKAKLTRSDSPAKLDVAAKVSGERGLSIACFKSDKPLTTKPETNFASQNLAQSPQEQPDVLTVDDNDHIFTFKCSPPSPLPTLPTGFDGFKHDHVQPVPVEDEDPPPAPLISRDTKTATEVSSEIQRPSTQASDKAGHEKKLKVLKPVDEHTQAPVPNFTDATGAAAQKSEGVGSERNGGEEEPPTERKAAGLQSNVEGEKKSRERTGLSGKPPNNPASSSKSSQETIRQSRERVQDGPHRETPTKRALEEDKLVVGTEETVESSRSGEDESERSLDRTERVNLSGNDEKGVSRPSENVCGAENVDIVAEKKDSFIEKPGDDSKLEAGDDRHHIASEEVSEIVTSVEDLLRLDEKSASVFLRRSSQTSRACRELLAQCYAQQTKLEFGSDARYQLLPKRRRVLPPMGPLAQIEIEDQFDSVQVWEELELRNKPLLAFLNRKVSAIEKKNKEAERALRRITLKDDDSGTELVLPHKPHAEEDGEEQIEKHDSDGPNEVPEHEVSQGDEPKVSDEDDRTGATKKNRGHGLKRKKVQFSEVLPIGHPKDSDSTERNNVEDRRTKTMRKQSRLEDGFFSIADMDRFADEAEDLALSGKLMATDEDQNSEKFSDDSEDDLEEIETEDKLGRYLYTDFFDPPCRSSGSKEGVKKALQLLEEDEMSESDDQKVNHVDEEKGIDSPAPESDVIEEGDAELTPLQRMRVRTMKRIEILEEASVAKKPWELRGEVSAFARPKDSLLETEMRHDIAVKPKTFLSSEINKAIEDMIKQRIVDGLYDDVVMRLPEDYVAKKSKKGRVELPEISQEKPSEGLAELYAKEFTEEREKKNKEMLSSNAVQKESDEPLGEQQKEINKLFEKLSKKLDALSNLHYTPIPDEAKADVTVKANVKALASEEAIPEGISSAALLAPKEVYSVDKKNLVGEKELEKEDRRAARRRRKSKTRKTRAADDSRKDALAQTDPVLAEKRKAETALTRRGKKPKLGVADPSLAAQSKTKNLIKRFGVATNPGDTSSSQRRKPVSHFRL